MWLRERLYFAHNALWWLLRTSVRKMDDFALDFCIFSELWHTQMTECKGISRVFLHHAEAHAAPVLFLRKLTGRKFLSSTPNTRWYAERHLFKYYGLSLEALRLLFGTRGVTHPRSEPR